MDKKNLKIVFMGTPEFAVASLEALVENGFNVVAVVTAPDKPAGRGMQLQQSAVKKYAVEKSIEVLQPVKLRDEQFIIRLQELDADIQIVVAFRMLPEIVWNMPPMGTLNVHGSLLPQYRGAAPINWAIINGEKETGVTTFKLQHAIDTGNILLQDTITITEDTTAGSLHDEMKTVGANTLIKTLEGLLNNSIEEQPQQTVVADETALKHAPKIFTEDCRIDFSKPVEQVYNLVRGLSPYPGAFTMLNGKTFKIYKARKAFAAHSLPAGELTIDKGDMKFACADGFLIAKEIQAEGKKKMNAADFLRGYRPA
jgi:methionyl-tRNA formyltransferase